MGSSDLCGQGIPEHASRATISSTTSTLYQSLPQHPNQPSVQETMIVQQHVLGIRKNTSTTQFTPITS
eukprot:NODE_7145_length_471_cov_10.812796_g6327_i0.p2 GENE.NODE_7145_length_471_cov_10.812796_g6327_i0~~NODE_7145_length_471_cov_10.812796_g6327_i0.p2  ORF type:complete len:75 (+),score=15.33 NODE_7145_length_471_cov_10.812796_g6327_i0:23-226(+)